MLTVPTVLHLPTNGMILLIGASGSGKSTFASRHFMRSEVLSSDEMRAVVADDPNDQSATEAAFELLHTALAMRLARRRLSVVDATNVERWARGRLLAVSRRLNRPAAAIVFDLPLETLLARAATRVERYTPPAALRRQLRWLRGSLPTLAEEGLNPVYRLTAPDEVDLAVVERH